MIQVIAARHFIDKGLPVNGAVALTGVFYYESKLNPGSQGVQGTETPGVLNNRGAYAIMSLNGPRQQRLKDYCDKRGVAYDNLEAQLDFALNEMANHYPKSWAAIRSSDSYEAIIATLVDDYENPADKPKEIAGAIAFAAPLLEEVKYYVPASRQTPAPSSQPSTTTTGSLQMPIELILQLVAPLAENLVSGLLKGVLTHIQANGIPASPASPVPVHPAAPAPAMPAIDFAQLAQLIAAELAKLQQGKPA